MNSLNRFLSEFKRGFQQTERFICQVFVKPEMIANIILQNSYTLLDVENVVFAVPQAVKWLAQGFALDAARTPDRAFDTTNTTHYGFEERIPHHTRYSGFEAQFLLPYGMNILSRDNIIPRFFAYWQNQIHNCTQGEQSGFDFTFPDSYYGSIILTLLDRQNRGTLSYKLEGVYPATVNSIQLNWNQTDFARLPVSFNYSYWRLLPLVESLALSFIDQIPIPSL
jgi:hypothetical protein